MAYPTGTLSKVLEDIDRDMISLKNRAVRYKDRMAAGNVSSSLILNELFVDLRNVRARLVTAAATDGIADYAKSQKDDANLNVVTEFQAVIAAVDAVTGWITTNFPADGDGYLLAQTLGQDGPVDRQFSSAQTAGLRTVLDALIATID